MNVLSDCGTHTELHSRLHVTNPIKVGYMKILTSIVLSIILIASACSSSEKEVDASTTTQPSGTQDTVAVVTTNVATETTIETTTTTTTQGVVGESLFCKVTADVANTTFLSDLSTVSYHNRGDTIWIIAQNEKWENYIVTYTTELEQAGDSFGVSDSTTSEITTENYMYYSGATGQMGRVDKKGSNEEIWAAHPPDGFLDYYRTYFTPTSDGQPALEDLQNSDYVYIITDEPDTILTQAYNRVERKGVQFANPTSHVTRSEDEKTETLTFDVHTIEYLWPVTETIYSENNELTVQPYSGGLDVADRFIFYAQDTAFDVYNKDMELLYTKTYSELIAVAGFDPEIDVKASFILNYASDNILWMEGIIDYRSFLIPINAQTGKPIVAIELPEEIEGRELRGYVGVAYGENWYIAGAKNGLYMQRIVCE